MTYSENELVVAGSGTRRRVVVGLPNTRIIGHAEPANIVRKGVNKRAGLRVVPLLNLAVQHGRVAEHLVERISGVDGELVRKELNE